MYGANNHCYQVSNELTTLIAQHTVYLPSYEYNSLLDYLTLSNCPDLFILYLHVPFDMGKMLNFGLQACSKTVHIVMCLS